MRKKRKKILLILISTFFGAIITYILLTFPPQYNFVILNFNVNIIPLFLFTLFAFLYSLFTLILSNKRRGFEISLFTITFLLLRLLNLTHPFFLILLIVLFGGIELFFVKRK